MEICAHMKKNFFLAAHSCFFALGVVQFLVRGINSERAHQALITSFVPPAAALMPGAVAS
jgi:hypothetical protein